MKYILFVLLLCLGCGSQIRFPDSVHDDNNEKRFDAYILFIDGAEYGDQWWSFNSGNSTGILRTTSCDLSTTKSTSNRVILIYRLYSLTGWLPDRILFENDNTVCKWNTIYFKQ